MDKHVSSHITMASKAFSTIIALELRIDATLIFEMIVQTTFTFIMATTIFWTCDPSIRACLFQLFVNHSPSETT